MKQNIKPTIVLGTICVVVALLLSVINMVTAPIIEAQRAAAASGALRDVMPEGETFDEIDISTLGLPEAVVKAWKETTGKGYVFQMSVAGYQPGLVIMCGVDADGKITGSKFIESNETYGLEKLLDNAYNGKTLEDASLIIAAGASANSATSKAYFAAIDAALQANVLVGGGELSPSIVLKGLIPKLAPGFTFKDALACEELSGSGNITLAYKAKNGAGLALIVEEGEAAYLAIVNAVGSVKVYDVESKDVTAEKTAIADEAKTFAAANQTNYAETLAAKVEKLAEGATEITPVTFDAFGNVVAAVQFKVGDATQYAFLSRPLTYEENAMEIYTIVNADGAIVKQDIAQILFGHGIEYMPVYKNFGDSASSTYVDYENGFGGLTVDTLGNHVMISGATISSNAIKTATTDAFNVFNAIKNGGTN